jgi:hypothetical protein
MVLQRDVCDEDRLPRKPRQEAPFGRSRWVARLPAARIVLLLNAHGRAVRT